jgi:hypothetical protein
MYLPIKKIEGIMMYSIINTISAFLLGAVFTISDFSRNGEKLQ